MRDAETQSETMDPTGGRRSRGRPRTRQSNGQSPPQAKASAVEPQVVSERAKRLLQWRQDGVTAASEYEAKERATRLLTARLRTERLARETASRERDRKRAVKSRGVR